MPSNEFFLFSPRSRLGLISIRCRFVSFTSSQQFSFFIGQYECLYCLYMQVSLHSYSTSTGYHPTIKTVGFLARKFYKVLSLCNA